MVIGSAPRDGLRGLLDWFLRSEYLELGNGSLVRRSFLWKAGGTLRLHLALLASATSELLENVLIPKKIWSYGTKEKLVGIHNLFWLALNIALEEYVRFHTLLMFKGNSKIHHNFWANLMQKVVFVTKPSRNAGLIKRHVEVCSRNY